MANVTNYNRVCPHCNGECRRPIPTEGLSSKFWPTWVCPECHLGIQTPKRIIHKLDRFEAEIIY